jgi:hypothetical protein
VRLAAAQLEAADVEGDPVAFVRLGPGDPGGIGVEPDDPGGGIEVAEPPGQLERRVGGGAEAEIDDEKVGGAEQAGVSRGEPSVDPAQPSGGEAGVFQPM